MATGCVSYVLFLKPESCIRDYAYEGEMGDVRVWVPGSEAVAMPNEMLPGLLGGHHDLPLSNDWVSRGRIK
jgi:hypothetical protein